MTRVIVAGGGTGGHLFPGLAVVEELRRRLPGVEVMFVGTARGIESRVLPSQGERLSLIEVAPLKGGGVGQLWKGATALPRAAASCRRILKEYPADLVLGVGGYASGPMLAVAVAAGVRTAVLEQNALVGLTNRMLAPVVGRAYVSFEETLSRFPRGRGRFAGNPVRRAIVEAAHRAAMDPVGDEARAREVLVLGGSQGSRALNVLVPELLARAGLAARGLRVLHQTGEAMRAEVDATYRRLGLDAEVVSFIDDMAEAYARALLVVGRAGATTVAELCALGRAAVLVPYPHAADDHQRRNAEALEAAGAARCLLESQLGGDEAAGLITSLLGDPDQRSRMARAARALGRPDAAATIVDDLLEWLGLEGTPGGGVGERRASESPGTGPAGGTGPLARGPSYRPHAGAWSRVRPASVPPHRRPLDDLDVDTGGRIE